MSSPYVYTPHSTYQPNPYTGNFFQTPQSSPFIPDATLYPPSPYTAPTTANLPYLDPPGTPNTPRRVRFEGDNFDYNYGVWTPPLRERRPSWHGGGSSGNINVPLQSPFLQPTGASYFNRRHSFGAGTGVAPFQFPQMQWGPYNNNGRGLLSPWSNQPQIHPWLNGESPRPDFIFDLSSSTFSPLRLVGPGQTAYLSQEDLMQPATHPPITRLQIICDMIPQWPINLEYNPYRSNPSLLAIPVQSVPPITLSDILVALHRSLHQRISHIDWARLSQTEELAVARSYTRRCRSMGSGEMMERSQGVKRVDFLLDRVWLKGLIRASGEGWDTMKLITG